MPLLFVIRFFWCELKRGLNVVDFNQPAKRSHQNVNEMKTYSRGHFFSFTPSNLGDCPSQNGVGEQSELT